MARYTGPKTKISRKFGEPLFGEDRTLEKKNYPPGQHGNSKRRAKKSEYAIQLMEKQKAKYTYGILEKQFKNIYDKANNELASIQEKLGRKKEAEESSNKVLYLKSINNSKNQYKK